MNFSIFENSLKPYKIMYKTILFCLGMLILQSCGGSDCDKSSWMIEITNETNQSALILLDGESIGTLQSKDSRTPFIHSIPVQSEKHTLQAVHKKTGKVIQDFGTPNFTKDCETLSYSLNDD